MRGSALLFMMAICGLAPIAGVADIKILPGNISLHGRSDRQQIVIERFDAGRASRDVTRQAHSSVGNPAIVKIGSDGCLIPAGDGDTTLTATFGKQMATVRVHVDGIRGVQPVPGFKRDLLPVLTRAGCNAGACHGAAAGKGGLRLSLRGYDPDADYDVLCRQARGRRVTPGSPEQSLVLLKPLMEVPHGGGERLKAQSPETATVRAWIKGGAPAPKPAEPETLLLEVFPESAWMHPGDKQQLAIRAHYSDGSVRDVTRLVKFGVTDAAIATVSDSGNVSVSGRGECAVTVWYASKVTTARIVSPFPGAVPVQPTSTSTSLVDKLVNKKLQELNLPASPIASDNEFIRRVFLDTAGMLPTLSETKQFLADTSADKRAKLIDQLLVRPETVDYWAYRWSDLLLLNSKTIPAESLNSFYGFIRKSVQENKPWDTFVREILTATGSTLENGAAGFYVIHKDPFDLTETTTQAFMGLSMMCAHCHNHPLERWTQKDYYQMANLFARVRLKTGDKPGEVFVLTADRGDIPHPRLGTPLAPRALEQKPLNPEDTADRRLALANWITGAGNPAFARSIVNRIWKNYFARGLVEKEDDIRATNPPVNGELMDAVTGYFVTSGYDIRKLMRLILTSDAYQRSSIPVSAARQDERQYSHYFARRLPAEALLDGISQAVGIPSEFKDLPAGLHASQLKDSQTASYFLTAFGRPLREKTCACERQSEPNVAQALHLVNGDTINARLKAPGGVIDAIIKAKLNLPEAMDQLYLSALCRYPTPAERKTAEAILGNMNGSVSRIVLEDLSWSVLTSREFVFNH